MMPAGNWFVVLFYVMFWGVRIQGCLRRGRQPLLRGRDWFFNLRVAPRFYEGPGLVLLRQYRLRMLIPFAIDIPWAMAIFASGKIYRLNYLIITVSAAIHLNHLWSVRLAERHARAFAVPETDRPTPRMALSLAPRRLRDYSDARIERALALATLIAVILLAREYHDGVASFRVLFALPLTMLYLNAGLVIAKRIIVSWRSPIPVEQADHFMRLAKEWRGFYAKMLDWARVSAVASMLFRPMVIAVPAASASRLFNVWLAAWLVIGMIGTVIVEIKRKQIVGLVLHTTPVTLPDLGGSRAAWPVCYQPATPMLVLKAADGYSLNLGSGAAKAIAGYLCGFVLLVFAFNHMAP
jgi:hypothetical protein